MLLPAVRTVLAVFGLAADELLEEHIPLVAQGLVDPERVGIIGFSRTCWYVMGALTTSALHIRAASVTDGVMRIDPGTAGAVPPPDIATCQGYAVAQ